MVQQWLGEGEEEEQVLLSLRLFSPRLYIRVAEASSSRAECHTPRPELMKCIRLCYACIRERRLSNGLYRGGINKGCIIMQGVLQSKSALGLKEEHHVVQPTFQRWEWDVEDVFNRAMTWEIKQVTGAYSHRHSDVENGNQHADAEHESDYL